MDPGQDFFGLKRLRNVIHRACPEGVELVFDLVQCADKDDRDVLFFFVGFEPLAGFVAIHSWHAHVKQNKVWWVGNDRP